MSLDGLRAWIGMVERKLAMRTRVFLVLVAIAIGGAAAAIYLSVEAQSNKVSEGDLQTLQTELTTRIEALETKVQSLEGEVQAR
jgi:peptidoglycan hydrolase CwlO-like protein